MSDPRPETAVVLLSGGLDSSFNFLRTLAERPVVLALTFDYGQRASVPEAAAARRLSAASGVQHKLISLPWFRDFTRTALLGADPLPSGGDVRIDDLEQSRRTAKSVWVPNRNGIFLSIAAGFAEGLGAAFVVPGFNREEAVTFPDNSAAFMTTLDQTWAYSTASGVRTLCHSAALDKAAIVREGKGLGLPLAELWPCYTEGPRWCGECESCQRYRRALAANGLSFDDLNLANEREGST
jgi:7-cyano-7-deazaguanine synthase